jgi:hypothetical protein
MSAYGSMTTTPTAWPMATAARLRRAWDEAGDELRRGAVAAAVTSVLLAVVTHLPVPAQVGLAMAGVAIAAAALVDVVEHRLPNALVAAAAVSPFIGAVAALDGHSAARSCLGAVIAGGAMLTVRLARGVGMGDVKMSAAVGAGAGALSPMLAAVAIAVTALAAAVWGVASGRRALPLGPALWLGWAAALALGSMGWWR